MRSRDGSGGVAQRPDDEFEASGLCPQCSRQLRIEMAHGQQPDTATARLPSTAAIQRRTAPRPVGLLHTDLPSLQTYDRGITA